MKKKTIRKSSVKIQKPLRKRKKKFLFWQRGQIALYLLLGIIILGAFILTFGGPQFSLSQDGNKSAGEVVPEKPDSGRDNLQLKTIRFQQCASKAAVDFLVDTSGSMNFSGKIGYVKEALKSFVGNFTDKSIAGIRRFSSAENQCPTNIGQVTTRLVPINFYESNKAQFTAQTNALCASGATNTRSAFAAELEDIKAAVADPKFKDHTFNVVFLSDGIPESTDNPLEAQCQATGADSEYCQYNNPVKTCRCIDPNQDPTTNPQLAKQIQDLKNLNGKNVRVYSILVFDPATDGYYESKFTSMMQAIASPDSFYKTTDPKKIKEIYDQISEKICASNGGILTPTP